MKTLHLDCFSGISGNMFVGMLIQAGVPFEAFQKAMASLQLTGYELLCRSENKGGVQAVYYNVLLDSEKEGHDAHHDHDHHDHDHHDHDHDHHDHHDHGAASGHLVDMTGHHHHHQHRG
ncbi:MAG: nickel insertion protein, partial [Megasphaera sp.]|nr:nickel insertion protein [Megasphaera sp.]